MGSGFELKEGKFMFDIEKKFFTMKVLRHWIRLPREVIPVSVQGQVGWGSKLPIHSVHPFKRSGKRVCQ